MLSFAVGAGFCSAQVSASVEQEKCGFSFRLPEICPYTLVRHQFGEAKVTPVPQAQVEGRQSSTKERSKSVKDGRLTLVNMFLQKVVCKRATGQGRPSFGKGH